MITLGASRPSDFRAAEGAGEGRLVEKGVDGRSFPVKSEYSLTEGGLGIVEIVKDMKRWALKWKITNIE